MLDANGDGVADVLVGSIEASNPYLEHVHVFSGKDGSILLTVTGEHTHDFFGMSVASLPVPLPL